MAAKLDAVNTFIDWFIPPAIAKDRDQRKQARIFLISHLFGPLIGGTVPAALYFVDPAPGFAVAVLGCSIAAFWVFPPILRWWGHYNTLALISIQNLTFCILWSCFFYGGVTSPTLPWVLTIPLLAFLYLSNTTSLRLTVLAIFAFNCAVFVVLYHLFPDWHRIDLPFHAMQGLGLISTGAAALYVAMMALFYGKVLASQGELEAEMREHMATATGLRRATAEAERAGAAKAEFLAKMSHELRTPLNAVIGYSQMLLEEAHGDGDDEGEADLGRIHNAGQQLLKLVNDILDLSKIEAGKMELYIEEVSIAGLLESVVESHRGAAEAKKLALNLVFEAEVGVAECDGAKLRRAIAQIVDNAIKFTNEGAVTITAGVSHAGSSDIFIEVRDTGIGIGAQQCADLFEKFTVADDASTSKYGGTGLGLALSRCLCRLMNGDITAVSVVGQGSRFTIELPRAPRPNMLEGQTRALDARIRELRSLVMRAA